MPARRGLHEGSASSVPSASMLPRLVDSSSNPSIWWSDQPFRSLVKKGLLMSSISIIGTGNMARAIGALAVAGGNTVEVIGRDHSKAADLAKALGGSATTGQFGAVPAGDIVIVSLLYANVIPVVAQYGDALAGKVIVDISKPFNSAADGLA